MSNLRLGVSKDILPYKSEEILAYDFKFNKFLINTFQFAFKGLATGAILSLLFVKKQRVIFYGGGFGAGYSLFNEFS